MEAWWAGIGTMNKAFVLAAMVFSVLFLWQIIAMLIGLGGDSHGHPGDVGMSHDHDTGPAAAHSGDGIGFVLVSIRSLLAFGTLFSWAGTLYLSAGTPVIMAILYSIVWGVLAMFGVSYLLYSLLRLQETGNATVWSAVGEDGSVYMDIPHDGIGKVRVPVSGAITFVNARSRNGEPLKAGTKVKVVGIIDDNTIEVEAAPT